MNASWKNSLFTDLRAVFVVKDSGFRGCYRSSFSSRWQPFCADFVTYPRNCYFTLSISSGREVHFSQTTWKHGEQHRCSNAYQPVFSNNKMIAIILTILVRVHCIDAWMCTWHIYIYLSENLQKQISCRSMPSSPSCTCSSSINGIIWHSNLLTLLWSPKNIIISFKVGFVRFASSLQMDANIRGKHKNRESVNGSGILHQINSN